MGALKGRLCCGLLSAICLHPSSDSKGCGGVRIDITDSFSWRWRLKLGWYDISKILDISFKEMIQKKTSEYSEQREDGVIYLIVRFSALWNKDRISSAILARLTLFEDWISGVNISPGSNLALSPIFSIWADMISCLAVMCITEAAGKNGCIKNWAYIWGSTGGSPIHGRLPRVELSCISSWARHR